jgi:hypothetical protein
VFGRYSGKGRTGGSPRKIEFTNHRNVFFSSGRLGRGTWFVVFGVIRFNGFQRVLKTLHSKPKLYEKGSVSTIHELHEVRKGTRIAKDIPQSEVIGGYCIGCGLFLILSLDWALRFGYDAYVLVISP